LRQFGSASKVSYGYLIPSKICPAIPEPVGFKQLQALTKQFIRLFEPFLVYLFAKDERVYKTD
jgi:hypothetical protein